MKRQRKRKSRLIKALDTLEELNSKKKRRKMKNPENPIATYGNLGGHLFGPPKDCPYAFTMPDGGRWTDLGSCQRHSCRNYCEVYKSFFARGKKRADRDTELRAKGVRI